MNLTILIVVIAIIGVFLAFGGMRLSKELKGINFKSVSGALVSLAIVARYILLLGVVVPIMLLVHYLEWREPPNPPNRWFEHVFNLEFENQEFLLSSTAVEDSGLTTINEITGTVHFGQVPGTAYAIFFVACLLWLFFAYQFLRHSESVLRSLYNRTPFLAGNDLLVKKIAAYGLAIALTSKASTAELGWHLSQTFTVEGVTLSPTDFSILRPLVVVGVIFVMSEVFRIGRELKEENELTV